MDLPPTAVKNSLRVFSRASSRVSSRLKAAGALKRPAGFHLRVFVFEASDLMVVGDLEFCQRVCLGLCCSLNIWQL